MRRPASGLLVAAGEVARMFWIRQPEAAARWLARRRSPIRPARAGQRMGMPRRGAAMIQHCRADLGSHITPRLTRSRNLQWKVALQKVLFRDGDMIEHKEQGEQAE